MSVVPVVLGACWAMIGVGHLIRLSRMSGAGTPSDGMAAFGSRLRPFIFPGAIIALAGMALYAGIVNITAEDYAAMPPQFDGQWVRDNFSHVAQPMDRFIDKIKAETHG